VDEVDDERRLLTRLKKDAQVINHDAHLVHGLTRLDEGLYLVVELLEGGLFGFTEAPAVQPRSRCRLW
jgi:hypothetical protein